MKRSYLAPLLGIGMALLILVPTTFAVGESGTSLYANFGSNRFPGGATNASAQLRFIDANQISLDVFVQGNDLRNWTLRVYSEGSCNNVIAWAANRQANGQPLNRVATNQGVVAQLLYFADVDRIRAALAQGKHLAMMFAGDGSGGAQTNSPYRTCALFGTTPPTTTTTSTTSTKPTTTTTTSTTTTRTSTSTTTSSATTTTSSSTSTTTSPTTTSTTTSTTTTSPTTTSTTTSGTTTATTTSGTTTGTTTSTTTTTGTTTGP